MRRFLIIVSSVVLLFSCNGKMKITEMGPEETPSGLKVQLSENRPVTILMLTADGKPATRRIEMHLPSRTTFYDLGFKGPPFGSAKMAVELHPNGGLKAYSISRVGGQAEVATQIATLANKVTGTLADIKVAESAANAELPTINQDNEKLKAEILRKMLEANQAALEAGTQIPFPEIIGLTPGSP